MNARQIADLLIACFADGNMAFVCGNGGSYDLARHFEEEMLCKFKVDRLPLPMLALKAHTSISNDYGYDQVFSRQIEAYGHRRDVFIGISTSGNSKNVNMASQAAWAKDMVIITFPRIGNSTAEIQENQLKLVHEISGLVEEAFTNE